MNLRQVNLTELRKRAEQAIAHSQSAFDNAPGSPAQTELQHLVEELRVYQSELEIQNEELSNAQSETSLALEKYRALFDHLPLPGLVVNGLGFIVEANNEACDLLALPRHAAMRRRSALHQFDADSRGRLHQVLRDRANPAPQTIELLEVRRGNGENLPCKAHIVHLCEESGHEDRTLLILIDQTTEIALRESDDRYSALFMDAKAIMLLIDPETGAILEANPAAQKYYGYDNTRMRRMTISDINTLSPDEIHAEMRRAQLEKREHFFFPHRLASGEIRQVEVHSGPFRHGGKTVLYSIIHDVTARQAEEFMVGFLAHHDRLTELPNRDLFYDRLSQAISRARRKQERLAVFFLDLDDFKPINDSYGHEAGDASLVLVAKRLQACVRSMDTTARLGGDEFAVILGDIAKDEDAICVAEKIIASLSEPMPLREGVACRVGVSIGIAIYPDNGIEIDKLMNAADDAMYESKASGKNTYTFFRERAKRDLREAPWIILDAAHLVGAPIVDQQHQVMANMLNRLNTAVTDADEPAEVTSRLFDELVDYSRFHFATEERLMTGDTYADQVAHKEAHEKLLVAARHLRGKFVEGGELAVLQSLKDWVLSHIVSFDKGLARHMATEEK